VTKRLGLGGLALSPDVWHRVGGTLPRKGTLVAATFAAHRGRHCSRIGRLRSLLWGYILRAIVLREDILGSIKL
jgi:hypothetical protein